MKSRIIGLAVATLTAAAPAWLPAQDAGTAFTYQGRLTDNGAPATGTYDFEFGLYELDSGGIPIALMQVHDVVVTGGAFTVVLDFGGSIFTGPRRFLQPAVRPGGSSGGYTSLLPRQELTPGPYAMHAESATTAATATTAITATNAGDADTLDGLESSAFFALAENEIVSGRPAFNGGTTGATSPFTVDSSFVVTSLNADLLDGLNSTAFLRSDASTTFSSGTLTLGAGTTLSLPAGTAAAPSLNFIADTNTGLFSPGVDNIALATAGTESLRVDASGDLFVRDRLFLGGNIGNNLVYDVVQTRYEFSTGLGLVGALNAGQATASYAYNAFGTGAPVTTGITGAADLLVAGSAEVKGDLAVDGTIQVGVLNPGGFSYNTFRQNVADLPVGGLMSTPGDVFVGAELEVGGGLIDFQDLTSNEHIARLDTASGAPDWFRISTRDGAVAGEEPEIQIYATGGIMRFATDTDNDTGQITPIYIWYNNGTNDTIPGSNRIMDLDPGGALRLDGTITQNFAFDIAEAFYMAERVEPGDVVRVSPDSGHRVLRSAGEGDGTVLGIVSARPGFLLGGAAMSIAGLRRTWGEEIAARYEAERNELEAAVLGQENGLAERGRTLSTVDRAALASRDAEGPNGPDDRAARHDESVATWRGDVEVEMLKAFFARHFAPVALAGRVPVKVDASFGEIRVGDLLAPSPVPGVAMKATKPGPVIGTALEALAGGQGRVLAFVHRSSYTPAAVAATSASAEVEALREKVARLERLVESLAAERTASAR